MTFSKVSVLVPTRGRVGRLKTLITSFDLTTGNGPDCELVFRIDEDDYATRDFLLGWGGHQVVIGPRLLGYRSMPTFFNELAACASGDVLMCGNDDMVFQTPGWQQAILTEANAHPDGLFNIGVKTFNETHWPFSCIAKDVTRRLGFLWDPRIFWGDIFLRDVMGTLGKNVMLPDVQIDHDWAGNAPDDVFNQSDKSIAIDYWTDTHPTSVREAVARLKEAA